MGTTEKSKQMASKPFWITQCKQDLRPYFTEKEDKKIWTPHYFPACNPSLYRGRLGSCVSIDQVIKTQHWINTEEVTFSACLSFAFIFWQWGCFLRWHMCGTCIQANMKMKLTVLTINIILNNLRKIVTLLFFLLILSKDKIIFLNRGPSS